MTGVGRLLQHLADQKSIRPIALREFHFLVAHGAAAIYSLVPLATLFDPAPGRPCRHRRTRPARVGFDRRGSAAEPDR